MSQLAQAPPSCPQPLRLHLLTEPIDRRLGATPSVRDVQCCQRHLHNTQCAKDHGRIDVSHMGDAEPLAGELAGTAAAYSGPLIFEQLKLDVEKTFIPHQIALEQMRTGQGDMAAVVFVTSKPVDAFQRRKWDPGFKFLPVPFEDFGFYLPSTLTSNDYPDLIPQGQEVDTIAIPTILAAFNWQKGSDSLQTGRAADGLPVQSFGQASGAGLPSQMEGCQPQRKGARAGSIAGGAGVARQSQCVRTGSNRLEHFWCVRCPTDGNRRGTFHVRAASLPGIPSVATPAWQVRLGCDC
jgi:hypothetical protein